MKHRSAVGGVLIFAAAFLSGRAPERAGPLKIAVDLQRILTVPAPETATIKVWICFRDKGLGDAGEKVTAAVTRAGMGACQGRGCEGIAAELMRLEGIPAESMKPFHLRPPLFPMPVPAFRRNATEGGPAR